MWNKLCLFFSVIGIRELILQSSQNILNTHACIYDKAHTQIYTVAFLLHIILIVC